MTLKQSRMGAALALILTLCSATMAVAQGAPGAPSNLQASVSGNNLSLTWAAPTSGVAVPLGSLPQHRPGERARLPWKRDFG
jgi:hypothetical protein